MLLKEDCYCPGHIARTHSYKGEVLIRFDTDNPENYKELESVFVEIDGKLIPFFLEHFRASKKNAAVVKFEHVDSEEKAAQLVKCRLFLPLKYLPESDEKNVHGNEIEGYRVTDEKHGDIGIVTGVTRHASNPLIEIDHDGTEIMIPKSEEFIKEIDRKNKVLYISAPEGLIEMYLG